MSQSWLTPDAEQGGGSTTSTGVEQDSNWQESTNPAASASSNNDSSSSSNNKRGCCWWTHLFCGVVLSILFIVAASLEWNDANLAVGKRVSNAALLCLYTLLTLVVFF